MLNAFCSVLFKVVFFLLRWFFNIFLLPILPIINLFPQFSDFLQTALNFIDQYLFRSIAFGREVFFNMTGFPRGLINMSVNFSLVLISIIGTLRLIAFVKNIWRTFKGGN